MVVSSSLVTEGFFFLSLCSNSKRQYVKELIKKLKEDDPNIDKNIFISLENVNIDKVVGYKKGKEKYSIKENKEESR